MKTPAEIRFKAAVTITLAFEVYPGPATLRYMLGGAGHNLNGRECRWRKEVWEPWMEANPRHPITRRRDRLCGGSSRVRVVA